MPSTSERQRRTMAGIAHGWHPSHGDVAKIPLDVARDFNEADQEVAAKKKRSRLVLALAAGKPK